MTKLEIEDLGWKHCGTARNGGSLMFSWIDELTILNYHGENFIYKNENSILIDKIEIQLIDKETLEFIPLYESMCSTKKILMTIMKDLKLING